jgi:surface polysaccharide O-acyltransferase-like enzyme
MLGDATTSAPAALPPMTAQASMTARSHRVDIDALRVVAAIMVVTIHVTSVFISIPERAGVQGGTYWVALFANLASRCAVPAFFAISGWALMTRSDESDEASWLGRRLRRLLLPLVIWNIVYVGVALVVAQSAGKHLEAAAGWPIDWLLHEATLIVAGPGTAASLWFMYYLIPVTIVLWVVKVAPKAITAGRTRTAFGCAIAALILPYGLVGAFQAQLAWSSFGWAVGYAVLGYVIISATPPRRWISVSLYLGATAGLVVAERLIGYGHWGMAYNGPLVLAQTVGLVGLLRSVRIPDRWQRTLADAAKLTFGVYLVHLVFVQAFRITIGTTSVPQIAVLVISWVGTVTISFVVVALWHRHPRLQRVLG